MHPVMNHIPAEPTTTVDMGPRTGITSSWGFRWVTIYILVNIALGSLESRNGGWIDAATFVLVVVGWVASWGGFILLIRFLWRKLVRFALYIRDRIGR